MKTYPQYENYKITKITPTTNIQAIRTSNNSLFEEWILVFTEEVHYSNNTNGDYFIKYVEHEFKLDNPSDAFIILLEQYNKIQNYLLSIISK